MRKMVSVLALCFLLLSSAPAFADIDEGLITVGDLFISRPVGIAVTVVGSAIFIVSLPFALTSGSVKDTADTLVGEPFRFTFTRPLGYYKQYGSYGPSEKTKKSNVDAGEQKQAE